MTASRTKRPSPTANGVHNRTDPPGDADGDGESVLYDVCAANLKPHNPTWYSPGRIAWGTVVIFQGEKGVGKSTFLRAVAAEITGGTKFLGKGSKRTAKGGVLWYAGEESIKSRVLPGLIAAGADLSRCFLSDLWSGGESARLQLPADRARLERRIQALGIALVVLDPLFPFVDSSTDVDGPTMPARRFMTSLLQIAERQSCIICLSRNLVKDRTHGALSAGRGSAELGNAARAVLHLDRLPAERERFACSVASCNDGQEAPTLIYTLEAVKGGVRVQIGKEIAITADELCGGEEEALDRSQLGRARELLRQMLKEGEVESQICKQKADNESIPPRTLLKAVRAEGILIRRQGSRHDTQTYWRLPKDKKPPTPPPAARQARQKPDKTA